MAKNRNWQQAVLDLLCEIKLAVIACCEQPSCKPYSVNGMGPKQSNVTITTSPIKILGSNPNRISFTISAVGAAAAIRVSPVPGKTGTTDAVASINSGSSTVFNAYQFPTSIVGDWYAAAASGSQTVSIYEELSK